MPVLWSQAMDGNRDEFHGKFRGEPDGRSVAEKTGWGNAEIEFDIETVLWEVCEGVKLLINKPFEWFENSKNKLDLSVRILIFIIYLPLFMIIIMTCYFLDFIGFLFDN